MRVVLCKRTDAGQPMSDARSLVAVKPAEISHPNGKIPVGVPFGSEDLSVTRAVHGLDAVLPLVDFRKEHCIDVVVVVAGDLEQLDVPDHRSDHFLVLVASVVLLDETDQLVVDDGSLREEDRH